MSGEEKKIEKYHKLSFNVISRTMKYYIIL